MGTSQADQLLVQRYLARIGCTEHAQPTLHWLKTLQTQHLLTVPYENLDIIRAVSLSLEIGDLYDKIVIRRRGGYCFELNALFGWLLETIGFRVTSHFARFWRDEPDPPPKRRHHVLKVEVDGEVYLCDVGVGGVIARQPLRLVEGLEQVQGTETYRFTRDEQWGWMLAEKKGDMWRDLYSFTEERQLPKDFLMVSYWCEHAPDSIFRQGAMVSLLTPDGRYTVSGEEFHLFSTQGVQVFRPPSKEAYHAALAQYFGLKIV
ncbi:MAG: arylamine N-acetyltransferase [Firmicutes bacterium]|nr:arylamine N-acetyltransferase [Bacillota bacterium]